ncbi:MAG: hypothetical protein JNL43_04620 [Flavobacteriales bacterium]|nr:hypothetical protein [Flavobacteriales bacterium]
MPKVLKWFLLFSGAALLAVMVLVAAAFPFLAVNDPSGAKTVVVEGWIPSEFLPKVKAEIDRRGYERVYTTGTPRNLSYTLRMHDTISVVLRNPEKGRLIVSACGSDGSGFRVIADNDTVLERIVTPTCKDYSASLRTPVERLALLPTYSMEGEPDWEMLFTLYVELNGTNVHELQRSTTILRASGTRENGLPTFADAAADQLRKAGLEASKVTPLPTTGAGASRTWANARRFGQQARSDGLKQVDVISLGIHARRSRAMYRKACGPDVEVGIISLDDPEMKRGTWWMEPLGWLKVMKELAGVPAGYLVEEGP